MCNPTMIVSAITSVVSYQQQVEAANQQQEYQNAVARARNEEIDANNKSANASAIDSYTQINQKQVEQQASASQENLDLNAEKTNSVGQLAASNLNTGLSFDALKLDYERQADRYEGVQQASLKSIGLQTNADKKQTNAKAQSQMNSIQGYIQQPVSTPSPWSLAVSLGGSVATGLTNKNSASSSKNSSTSGTTSDWRDGGSYRKVNYNY